MTSIYTNTWIDVLEALPEYTGDYLVAVSRPTSRYCNIIIADWDGEYWTADYDEDVT